MPMPRPIEDITAGEVQHLKGVFCDIDDTLTWEGRLVPEAFAALARLQSCGLRVIPITGRPAGWVDHIARMWPVDGVVGENGGLWFFMSDGQLQRRFLQSTSERSSSVDPGFRSRNCSGFRSALQRTGSRGRLL